MRKLLRNAQSFLQKLSRICIDAWWYVINMLTELIERQQSSAVYTICGNITITNYTILLYWYKSAASNVRISMGWYNKPSFQTFSRYLVEKCLLSCSLKWIEHARYPKYCKDSMYLLTSPSNLAFSFIN